MFKIVLLRKTPKHERIWIRFSDSTLVKFMLNKFKYHRTISFLKSPQKQKNTTDIRDLGYKLMMLEEMQNVCGIYTNMDFLNFINAKVR